MTTTANNNLFEPVIFGQTQLQNRIVMAPMTRNQSPGGVPTDAVVAYYASRAKGSVGLIISEGTYIGHPGANSYAGVPAFHGEAALAGWKQVIDAVHAAGGKMMPQIWHVGAARALGVEPDPSVPGFGPMGAEVDNQVTVKAMTQQDINEAVAAYAQAAADAEQLGFDGVEIHGAHGYLIDQFLWAGNNQRKDGYGGNLQNRLRFALEVVAAVRAKVSQHFPVVFRFSQWKLSDYDAKIANNATELAAIVKPLADVGVDYFHVSTRRLWAPAFAGSDENLASLTRRLSGKPVIAVGSVGLEKEFRTGHFTREENPDSKAAVDITQLEQGISNNSFDLVAVGRALLADPQWANKVKTGRLNELTHFDVSALDNLVTA